MGVAQAAAATAKPRGKQAVTPLPQPGSPTTGAQQTASSSGGSTNGPTAVTKAEAATADNAGRGLQCSSTADANGSSGRDEHSAASTSNSPAVPPADNSRRPASEEAEGKRQHSRAAIPEAGAEHENGAAWQQQQRRRGRRRHSEAATPDAVRLQQQDSSSSSSSSGAPPLSSPLMPPVLTSQRQWPKTPQPAPAGDRHAPAGRTADKLDVKPTAGRLALPSTPQRAVAPAGPTPPQQAAAPAAATVQPPPAPPAASGHASEEEASPGKQQHPASRMSAAAAARAADAGGAGSPAAAGSRMPDPMGWPTLGSAAALMWQEVRFPPLQPASLHLDHIAAHPPPTPA